MSNVTLFLKHTVCIVLIASGVCCALPPQYTQDQYEFGAGDIIPATTKLSRMSVERIDKALLSYRGRMRRIKATSYATVAGIVGLAGYGMYRAWTGGKSKDVQHLEKNRQQLLDQLTGETQDTRSNDKMPNKVTISEDQQVFLQRQIAAYTTEIDQKQNLQPASNANNGTFWGIVTGFPIRAALTLGFAGLVVTSGYQVFRVVSGTLDEALQLLWHGYEYWYAGLEEQLRTLMNELRESFYQARKVVQQTSTEQQLIIARQQRRAPLAYEVSSHYRLDIVTLYQRLVGAFERLIALMLIIAPEEHHEVMQQQVAAIIAQFDRFAISLESDLNENTHGLLTHYSNKTLDTYHECIERVTIFLTTYRVHLRK
jgi:hypothetical protein